MSPGAHDPTILWGLAECVGSKRVPDSQGTGRMWRVTLPPPRKAREHRSVSLDPIFMQRNKSFSMPGGKRNFEIKKIQS